MITSLGFVRGPGRRTFKKACAGYFRYALRSPQCYNLSPRYCADVLYTVCPCICRCVRKLFRGFGADRATAAQPVKDRRLTWNWPPEAQVRALLWVVDQDPLLATLLKVAGTYADLRVTWASSLGDSIFMAAAHLQALSERFYFMLSLGL
jgi:hypothetical protein